MISPSTLEAAANVATAAAEALAGGVAGTSTSTTSFARRAALAAADTAAHFVAGCAVTGLAKAARPRTATARRKARGAGYASAKTASSGTAKASGTAAPKTSASSAKATAASGAKTTGALSFINDPKLSIEEKLFRLMAYLQNKYDKELEQKMKEMAGRGATRTSTASKTTSTSSTKKSNPLTGLLDQAKQLLPAAGIAIDALKNPTVRSLVSKISGPVLAAGASALGFPELAPLALKYGPTVLEAAAGVGSALSDMLGGPSAAPASASGGSAATAGASSSSASSGSTSSAQGPKSEQVQMMELQRLVNQQNEMFSMISNVMKSWHDTRSAIIANLR